MKKLISILLLVILIPAVTLSAQVSYDEVFLFFLLMMSERHEEIKNINMPDMEIHTTDDFEDEAVFELNFKKTEDLDCFIAALKEEDIPYGTFPGNNLRLILFNSDLLIFLMKTAIGL
jgi:hypothetical protein